MVITKVQKKKNGNAYEKEKYNADYCNSLFSNDRMYEDK